MNNTDFHIIWSLFSSSSRLQRKRAYLTIAAIAWGTVAILLLLAFGEGLKRQLDKNRRSTAENFAVMWPSETTKPWKGLPPGRPVRPRIDDVDFIASRMPELRAVIDDPDKQRLLDGEPEHEAQRARGHGASEHGSACAEDS